MLLSEQAVRDNLRNRQGKRVYFLRPQDQLSSAARDFLSRERVEIRPAAEARLETYRLLGGGVTEKKPEHMTHLHGDVLVRKTHPRIRFRGKVDSFQGILLLAQAEVPEAGDRLGEILDLSHRLLRADVLEEPLEAGTLCGFSEEELHRRSHFPQEYYGVSHFMPSAGDGRAILLLNLARCACREAELQAVDAFSDREGNPIREDLLLALNRMSSMLYILMIEKKAGKL